MSQKIRSFILAVIAVVLCAWVASAPATKIAAGVAGNWSSSFSDQITPEVAAPTGLVAYYAFNDNAQDMSGNGNHGQIFGAAFVNGKFGKSLEFSNSNNTYVEVPHSESLSPSKAVTISLWAKAYSYSTWHSCLLYKAGEEPTSDNFKDRCYTLWLTEPLGVHFTSTPEGAVSQIRCDTIGGLYEVNKFVHVAGIVDTENHMMQIYINGSVAATCEYSGTIRGGNYPLRIGAPFLTLGDQSGFNGVIDEVKIFNRALSADEIRHLANPSNISSTIYLLMN
jgi:hypothetical protein